MQSALRAVEVLCFGEMGNVLGTPRSLKVPDILTRRVILELDAVTNADKIFLIESLLLWVHHFRLAEGSRETFKHAIIVEEAHHILLRKKQEVTGEEAVTDVLLREIRELGESVICLDQHPSLISKPALGNTYTTFAFNLKHRGDIAMIQDCLHLDAEQAGYLNRLDVGWAIVKLQGRWFFPFLIKLPLFTVDKGSTTDEDIRQRNAKLLALDSGCQAACGEDSESIPTQEASTLPANTRDGRILPIPPNDKLDEMDDREPKECAIQLTTQEKDFLTDVWRHPSSTVTSRYRRLSLGPNVGNSVQYALRSLGLLASTVVPLPSGYARILSLTESGRRLLGISGGETKRHGGREHMYWVRQVGSHVRKAGWTAIEEAPIGHRRTVDVLAIHGGKRVAMEVETGRADVASNIRKCLDAGIDKVVVLRTSRCSEGKLMKAIGKRTTAQPRRPNTRPRLSRGRPHVLK